MFILIIVFIVEMITSLFLRNIFPNIELKILSVIYIGLNSIIVCSYLYRYKQKLWIFATLQLGYIIRVGLLLLDIYGREYIILPNSAADSEVYFRYAINISKDITLLNNSMYDMYSKGMGIIGYFFGPERMILQYTNVILGMATIFIVYKILNKINIDNNVSTIVIGILCILPNFMIMSAIFLREAAITFLVTASFYYFVDWYITGKISEFFKSTILILMAMSLHSGVVGVLIGYGISYIIYNPKKQKIVIDSRTVMSLIVAFSLGILIVGVLGDSVFAKFNNIKSIQDLDTHIGNYAIGGSEYLGNLIPNNILQVVLYLPIRALYFIGSPMLWDIRGINDIIAILFSSIYYLTISVLAINMQIKRKSSNKLITLILIILGITISIFAFGTSNAGTAVRHRDKLLGIVTIIFALVLQNRKNNKIINTR